jgi:hypothetical protein
MTKAYPSIQRNDLVLLQEIASYMLLACGAVYVISVSLESYGDRVLCVTYCANDFLL